jgi:tRNA(Ile)-lysidine synthase
VSLVDELAARCRFPDRPTLDCAVSGGADSLALLVLACHRGRPVSAVHVDHGLRPDSAADADVVADAARRFGAGFVSHRVQVDHGPNLEARARAARYAVLPDGVLTGHTADDQVETILLNLMRGAGIDGLAGIRRERRPLLDLRRSETVALCEHVGLQPVVDPTNEDLTLRRNRVRAELGPLLDEIAERDVVPVIARQADYLREVADWLGSLAESVDASQVTELVDRPSPVARVALRRFIQEQTGADHPPSADTLARSLDVVHGRIRSTELGRGWTLRRRHGVLRVESGSGRG